MSYNEGFRQEGQREKDLRNQQPPYIKLAISLERFKALQTQPNVYVLEVVHAQHNNQTAVGLRTSYT